MQVFGHEVPGMGSGWIMYIVVGHSQEFGFYYESNRRPQRIWWVQE